MIIVQNKFYILNKLKKQLSASNLAKEMAYFIISSCHNKKNLYLLDFIKNYNLDISIQNELKKCECLTVWDLQNIIEESIESENKKENGIVYTPKYIVDYIIDKTIDFKNIKNAYILDPACGCGAFLCSIIEKIVNHKDINIIDFIENNLYGFDINPNCAADIYLLINILLLELDIYVENLKLNIFTCDSLFSDWDALTKVKFDYIVGNPPYVKVQNMEKEYNDKLRSAFRTTKSGGFNLFYAFIEKSMNNLKPDGKLGFIIPNNFLKIKSGKELRDYISNNKYLSLIIDFDCNMIFSPVMTYNAIIILDKSGRDTFLYSVLEKTNNIEKDLNTVKFTEANINSLDGDRWLLLSDFARKRIEKIESFPNKIGPLIKTGIATLRDKLYIIDEVKNGKFYKIVGDKTFEIEREILRPLYKVSEIEDSNNITKNVKYIIFPYDNQKNPKTLDVETMKRKFPNTLDYFYTIKSALDERNKIQVKTFYEYGRSQGLNNKGKKLMYSQFLAYPKFILCEDEDALICNGFAIYETPLISISILRKILQSTIMNYYVQNTSYSIDGGFKCFQKKYLKNFSFPDFTSSQLEYLNTENDQNRINKFLENVYFN